MIIAVSSVHVLQPEVEGSLAARLSMIQLRKIFARPRARFRRLGLDSLAALAAEPEAQARKVNDDRHGPVKALWLARQL